MKMTEAGSEAGTAAAQVNITKVKNADGHNGDDKWFCTYIPNKQNSKPSQQATQESQAVNTCPPDVEDKYCIQYNEVIHTLKHKLQVLDQCSITENETHALFENSIQSLKQHVQQQTEKIISEATAVRDSQLDLLSGLESNETERYLEVSEALQKKRESLIRLIHSADTDKYNKLSLELKEEITDFLSFEDPEIPQMNLPVFNEGKVDREMMCELQGELCVSEAGVTYQQAMPDIDCSSESKPISYDLELSIQLPPTVSNKTVTSICPDLEGGAWITMDGDCFLSRIDSSGKIIAETDWLGGQVRDLAINSYGCLFLIISGTSAVIKLSEKGDNAIYFYRNKSCKPMALCVADNNDIFVLVHQSHSMILRLNPEGVVIMSFPSSGNAKSYSITCLHGSDEISVVYINAIASSKIKTYDFKGKLIQTWNNRTWNEWWYKFYPMSITHDDNNFLLMTEEYGNVIYRINKNGSGAQPLDGRALQIKHQPSRIARDTFGKLWIGCRKGIIYVLKQVETKTASEN